MLDILPLITKLLPLYSLVGFGYLAGRFLTIRHETIAGLLIYFIAPAVTFYSVATMNILPSYYLLPVIFFGIAVLLSLTYFAIGSKFLRGHDTNILSAAAGSGNTGYFGLPLILLLLGQPALGIAVFCLMGGILYESTRSYYILARGKVTSRDALIKTLKLPMLYAFAAGLFVNWSGITISPEIRDIFTYVNGAFVILGMMIIGIVLATAAKKHFDGTFTSLALSAKFIAYPVFVGAIVFIDYYYLGLLNTTAHTVMLLLSVVPMAANTITYVSLLRMQPQKIAITVMISTIVSLLVIPVFVSIVLSRSAL